MDSYRPDRLKHDGVRRLTVRCDLARIGVTGESADVAVPGDSVSPSSAYGRRNSAEDWVRAARLPPMRQRCGTSARCPRVAGLYQQPSAPLSPAVERIRGSF